MADRARAAARRQSRLEPGAIEFTTSPSEVPRQAGGQDEGGDTDATPDELARIAAERRGVRPNPRRVLKEDPGALGLVRAVGYILAVPTYGLFIVASSSGYFFFAGIQTFALLFVRGHYHVDQATATFGLGLLVLGGLVGTLVSGHVTDLLLRHGFLTARVWIPACVTWEPPAC